MNYMKQGIIDDSYMIYEGKTGTVMLKECLASFFTMDSQLFSFQDYISSKNTTFTDLFDLIYFKSICESVKTSKQNCGWLMAGNLMNVSIDHSRDSSTLSSTSSTGWTLSRP